MFRETVIAVAACFTLTLSAAAEEQQQPQAQWQTEQTARQDRFVISDDTCGASRYAHLIGENYARVYQASLIPTDSMRQDHTRLITLEYTPYRLNFVVGGEGRIIAVGCF